MMKLRQRLTAAAAWLRARVDLADVTGFAGLAIAYDGAQELFGTGWARLGLGGLIVLVYMLHEAQALVRPTRGGNR